VASAYHLRQTLDAIFTALEGNEKEKTPNLISTVIRSTPGNGRGDLARVYTSKVCLAFSI